MRTPFVLTLWKRKRVIELWDKGLARNEIAKKLKVPKAALKRYLQSIGLHRMNNKVHHVDEADEGHYDGAWHQQHSWKEHENGSSYDKELIRNRNHRWVYSTPEPQRIEVPSKDKDIPKRGWY